MLKTKKIDQYNTCPSLVDEIFLRLDFDFQPKIIADFAAGKGALLDTAYIRWPKAKFVGTDCDPSCVSYLKRKNPKWIIGQCNFLSECSTNRCQALNNLDRKIDLVFLNPPFSARHTKVVKTLFYNNLLACSIGLAFVLNSTRFLNASGRVICFLPISTLQSERDTSAWINIRTFYDVKILNEFSNNAFKGVNAKIIAVELKPRKNRKSYESECIKIYPARENGVIQTKVIRGGFQMHMADEYSSNDRVTLIHTTNLKNNNVIIGRKLPTRASEKKIKGHLILVPRVGKPDKKKLILKYFNDDIIISDCLFALSCNSASDAKNIYDKISKSWGIIVNAYNGACAPYLTKLKLIRCLNYLGILASSDSDKILELEKTG